MSFAIRVLVEKDIPHILEMIREFADSVKLSDYCEVTEERLQTALFHETAVAEAIVAVENKTPIAYAIFYPNFLSFRGQRGFYLEDIYLKAEFRRQNLGEKMIRFIAKIGKSRGFERIDFQVLESNESAINFYKKLGAVVDNTERHFKFTDEAFQNLTL